MGFFKNAMTPPAQRNRINNTNNQHQQHHGGGVAHDPRPAAVRPTASAATQAYPGTTVSAAPATATATAAPVTAAPYNPAAYGAFPPDNAPVQAAVYTGGAPSAPAVAPVQATVYVPPGQQATATGAVPVQASAVVATALAAAPPEPSAPPAYNPSYHPQSHSKKNEYRNGDSRYWECAACTFPNLRTEANCKGCGSPIPPGLLMEGTSSGVGGGGMVPVGHAAHAARPQSTNVAQLSSQMNNLHVHQGLGGTTGAMRVHIPNGMRPGQKIKVRSPDGKEVVQEIPPQSKWHFDDNRRPYFNVGGQTSSPSGGGVGQPSSGGGVMRVHIPNGMRPGQKIKVQSPDGKTAVQEIPPQNKWHYDGNHKPYFNMGGQQSSSGGGGPSSGGSGQSSGGATMRVHVPNGMLPGQKIRVQSPDGKGVVQEIPPQSQWHYDDNHRPYFRMQFGGDGAGRATSKLSGYDGGHTANNHHDDAPPAPHNTTWRQFHPRASTQYTAPPLAMRDVPHAPRNFGSGIAPNGRHKSLIIGINYHGSRAELRGCINDARNMMGMLQRNGYPNDGSHMLLLTDERSRGSEYQPTVANIMKAFKWFMKDVRKGDVLFFHFSGHGGQQPDKTGHEVDGYNETLIPVDYERRGQISDDILWGSLVYALPEGARITALMDMCHSGTGLDLPYDYNVDTGRWKEDMNPAHSAGDVVLFSGCEDSQTSADVGGGYGKMAGGAMTQAFMGAYESFGGMGTYHEFLVAVKKQLRKKRFSQRPQLTSSQQFDANSRIFSLGHKVSGGGGMESMIEPNHNPKVGRQMRRRVRPARQGFGGGRGGNDIFGMIAGAAGAALLADALFG